MTFTYSPNAGEFNGDFYHGIESVKKKTSTKTKNKLKVHFIQWFFIFWRKNDVQHGGIPNSYGFRFINRMLRCLFGDPRALFP